MVWAHVLWTVESNVSVTITHAPLSVALFAANKVQCAGLYHHLTQTTDLIHQKNLDLNIYMLQRQRDSAIRPTLLC